MSVLKYLLIFIFSSLVVACATSTPIIAPDGSLALSVKCGAGAQDQCQLKAGEVCPGGYDIIQASDSQYLGQVGTSSVSGSWNRIGGGVYGSGMSIPILSPNTMLIRCKPLPVQLTSQPSITQTSEKSIKENPNELTHKPNPIALEWNQKSIAAADQGQWAEATRTGLVAVKSDPKYVDAYINLCRAYLGYGDISEAEASCQKAISIDATNLVARNNLSVIKERQGFLNEAVNGYMTACKAGYSLACSNFEKIKGYSPNDLRGAAKRKSDQAGLAIAKKDWVVAIGLANEAIEIYPDSDDAYINRASAYVNIGEIDLAMADANKAIDLNPNHGMAYNNRGAAWLAKGEMKKAKLDFDIACGLKVELGCANVKLVK